MIQKDLKSYASANWGSFLTPVTELSKERKNQMPLVEHTAQLYSFDDICKVLFPDGKVPTSADGIEITHQSIRLIEFKSGFKKKISKYNFDEEKGRCEDANKVCRDYWNLFFKNQQKETSELIDSIRFKALESYLTLEKQILPQCEDTPKQIPVIFTAVIDEDSVEGIVDIYADLSGRMHRTNSPVTDVRKALKRLVGLQDAEGNIYCYDRVEVLSAQNYVNQLRQRQ